MTSASSMSHSLSDDPNVYRTLLESTRAIPWRIDWGTMQFSYIGPQIEKVLGWSQASWISVNDWADRIHEEDRPLSRPGLFQTRLKLRL